MTSHSIELTDEELNELREILDRKVEELRAELEASGGAPHLNASLEHRMNLLSHLRGELGWPRRVGIGLAW